MLFSPSQRLVFAHYPKTAGTSVREWFKGVFLDYVDVAPANGHIDVRSGLKLLAAAKAVRRPRTRWCSNLLGLFRSHSQLAWDRRESVAIIGTIREPFDMLVSLYNYWRWGNWAGVWSIATVNGLSATDVTVEADISCVKMADTGLVARYSGPGDTFMYVANLVANSQVSTIQIWKNVDGAWSCLGRSGPVENSGTLRFSVVGSSLTVGFNGIDVISVTDSSISEPGAVGLRAGGSTAIRNFRAFAADPSLFPRDSLVSFSDGFCHSRGTRLGGSWIEQTGTLLVSNNSVVPDPAHSSVFITAAQEKSFRDFVELAVVHGHMQKYEDFFDVGGANWANTHLVDFDHLELGIAEALGKLGLAMPGQITQVNCAKRPVVLGNYADECGPLMAEIRRYFGWYYNEGRHLALRGNPATAWQKVAPSRPIDAGRTSESDPKCGLISVGK